MRHWCNHARALAGSLLVLLSLAACASYSNVDLADDRGQLLERIEVGDRARLVTRDNRELSFQVTGVSREGLSGPNGLIAWDDMQALAVRPPDRDYDTLQTVGWVVLLGGIIALALNADGGGCVSAGGLECEIIENP